MDKWDVLKKYFGYDHFRKGQEALVDAVLSGRDALGIMPTGGGKSLCYQLPALLLPGVSLVISPLISLMKDQVDSLSAMGIPSSFINSSMDNEEIAEAMRRTLRGEIKLLYVAPERLNGDYFISWISKLDISLITIDEAHCISQWGHDFRPSYRDIPLFISRLPHRPPVAAYTATATQRVIEDINQALKLKDPFQLVTGFDRPNLFYRVATPGNKMNYLKEYLSKADMQGSGIVYCATRKNVESVSTRLKQAGYLAEGYHGGMDSEQRKAVQERFMLEKTRIIVATNAFGMGIHKQDVRFVVHYNMPGSMEAYYQEAGRAGRDGDYGECILLYSPADIISQKLFIGENGLDEERRNLLMENLQTLINYCHTQSCLRKDLLMYFGENSGIENCGACSNCMDQAELQDITLEAQKILSCIYRLEQRYGMGIVIKVLRGSRDKKVIENRLDQVSTYGILKEYPEKSIREIIMFLVSSGYAILTTDAYPVLKLQQKARGILKGNETLSIKKERILGPRKEGKQKLYTFSSGLYEHLVALRKQIADQLSVPAFHVFSNKTLQDMAERIPKNKEAFLSVSGVGEKKCTTFGEAFLQVITQWCAENEMPQEREEEDHKESKIMSVQDRYNESWLYYEQGLSIEDIAKARGVTEKTIVKHLEKWAKEGRFVEWSRFVNEEKEQRIMEQVQVRGKDKLSAIKEGLDEDVSFLDIQVILSKIESSS